MIFTVTSAPRLHPESLYSFARCEPRLNDDDPASGTERASAPLYEKARSRSYRIETLILSTSDTTNLKNKKEMQRMLALGVRWFAVVGVRALKRKVAREVVFYTYTHLFTAKLDK